MALWRWLRPRSAEVGFRAAVDSLRPHSQRLWQALSQSEQRRFLRHARPWWDVHRHRIAPAIAAQLKELIASGRLEIVAGRTRDMTASDAGIEVTIDRRDGRIAARQVGFAFNCTGPLGNVGLSADPLLRALLEAGEIAVDPLSIGLRDDGEKPGRRADLGARSADQRHVLGDRRRTRYPGTGARRLPRPSKRNSSPMSDTPDDGDLVAPAPENPGTRRCRRRGPYPDPLGRRRSRAAKACSTPLPASPAPGRNMPAATTRIPPHTSTAPSRKSAAMTRSCC